MNSMSPRMIFKLYDRMYPKHYMGKDHIGDGVYLPRSDMDKLWDMAKEISRQLGHIKENKCIKCGQSVDNGNS